MPISETVSACCVVADGAVTHHHLRNEPALSVIVERIVVYEKIIRVCTCSIHKHAVTTVTTASSCAGIVVDYIVDYGTVPKLGCVNSMTDAPGGSGNTVMMNITAFYRDVMKPFVPVHVRSIKPNSVAKIRNLQVLYRHTVITVVVYSATTVTRICLTYPVTMLSSYISGKCISVSIYSDTIRSDF